jgi:molybdopterin-containing oxidoreductase family membrane subunit
MKAIAYRQIEGRSSGWWGLLAALAALLAAGLGSAWYMEHHGHIVTGMDNQIVWGLPHVFAVFLIVAASGALNVASIASVFGKGLYKPMARLSALLAVALLAGGLMVLVLDLGRADRLIVAMTEYNFKSIFAWNVFLYTGFFVIVAAYLWTMMDRTVQGYGKGVGMLAFIWRLALTTGTGSIFGFLVARQLYDTALLAPMFVINSFSYGLAAFLLVLLAAYRWSGREIDDAVVARLRNLLAVFAAAVLYFLVVFHLTNLYFAKRTAAEAFILLGGGVHTFMLWVGQVLVGNVIPLVLLLHPALSKSRRNVALAAGLIVVGGLAQMWVTIIGGQAFPLVMFPGMQESSSFYDGAVHSYAPSAPELFLGLSGGALALVMVALAIKFLGILPQKLDAAE